MSGFINNGNMTRVPTGEALNGPPRHLKWNAWNQLIEVRSHANALLQRNVYDALFRRATRELGDSSVIHCYYNEKWRPIEERPGGSSDPSAVYFWGARHRDDLARRDRDTNANGTLDESLWCLMDYFDPLAVVDDEGDVVERYAFNAFGVASFLAPNYSPRGSSAVAWDFLFHGQFEDAETGWQNYGYRYYSPEIGRWPNRDPIRERGGVNLYMIIQNSPLNNLDFLGLEPRWNPDDGRCLRCAANDPMKPGEDHDPRLSKRRNNGDGNEPPLERNTVSCNTIREALISRKAYDPIFSNGEGCECYKDGTYGYLVVFYITKSRRNHPDAFQYHFFREGSDGSFHDEQQVIGSREALRDHLNDVANEMRNMRSNSRSLDPSSFEACPAICFPEEGIDVD